MFSVIYSFKVKPDCEDDFVKGWKGLTQLIYIHAGGLGSRLHRKSHLLYLAYAQWPDKETWENANNNLPEHALVFREKVRNCCEKIETLHELEVVEDLLK